MNLQEEIKKIELIEEDKQFGEIARIKSGKLTYVVKMLNKEYAAYSSKEKMIRINAVMPMITISQLSSLQRNSDSSYREPTYGVFPIPRDNRAKTAIRHAKSKNANNKVNLLSPEETEKFGSQDAMSQLISVVKDYLNKNKPEFVVVPTASDQSAKRERVVEIVLGKLGYKAIKPKQDKFSQGQHEGLTLFSKGNPREITTLVQRIKADSPIDKVKEKLKQIKK